MRWAVMTAALGCSVAAAQPAPPNPYFVPRESEARAGAEEKFELPAFPKDGNLVKIQMDRTNFDFFVDLESVSVGKDGVVRYTLVARSGGGASNISYEGMFCKDRERKLYALGRADGTWSLTRNPQWTSISNLPVNVAQAALYQAYFCPQRTIVRDAEQARRFLKSGGDMRAGGSQNLWNEPR